MHSLLDAITCSYISLEAGLSGQSAMAAKEENEGNRGEKEEDAEERDRPLMPSKVGRVRGEVAETSPYLALEARGTHPANAIQPVVGRSATATHLMHRRARICYCRA